MVLIFWLPPVKRIAFYNLSSWYMELSNTKLLASYENEVIIVHEIDAKFDRLVALFEPRHLLLSIDTGFETYCTFI